jgi:hypothetical protein
MRLSETVKRKRKRKKGRRKGSAEAIREQNFMVAAWKELVS